MFRDDYKACFDDIKGDKALLEKILRKSENSPRKKVIKFNRNIISVSAAVFVLAMAGFMYNAGLLEGFLPSDNNEIVITEKTENAESVITEEKAIDQAGEAIIEKKNMVIEKADEAAVENEEKQTENVNEGVNTASSEEVMEDMTARIMVFEPTEYKGLEIFKEGIEEITEKYDEAERKFSYTDFEETKKVEITYYDEMPSLSEENAGGDVLEYIGETEDGYVKITAYGITEEYMSEIIESM